MRAAHHPSGFDGPSKWDDFQKMLKEYVDYVVGAVPKLIVDTTKVLREGNLVGANLRVDFL